MKYAMATFALLVGANVSIKAMHAQAVPAITTQKTETCLVTPERKAVYQELLRAMAEGKLQPEAVLAVTAHRPDICILEKIAAERKRFIFQVAQQVIMNARGGKYVSTEGEAADFEYAKACLLVLREGMPQATKTQEFYRAYNGVMFDPRADYSADSAFAWKN